MEVLEIKNKNIIFFGGKPVSARCLRFINEYCRTSNLKILGVVPRKKGEKGWWSGNGVPEMYETAEDLGLPIIKQEDVLNMQADLGISMLYYRIFPSNIIKCFKNGIVNFHPAPLPYYRGSNAVSHAIIKGDSRFGVSMHFVNEGVDKGDVIDVRLFPLNSVVTAKVFMTDVEYQIEKMFHDWLERILLNDLPAVSQSVLCEQLNIKPEYHSHSSLDGLREVNLDWHPEMIWNYVRALDFPPFEPAYVSINGKKIYLRASY